MIQPETWNAIGDYSTKVWSFIGPLVGVLVGAYVANRSHRKQWRVDNKKAEYRELLTAINGSFMKIVALSSHQPFFQDAQRDRDLLIAETDAARAVADSILIAGEVAKLRVMERSTRGRKELR